MSNLFIYGDDVLKVGSTTRQMERLYNPVTSSEMKDAFLTKSLLSNRGVMVITSEWSDLDLSVFQTSRVEWSLTYNGLPDKRTKLFKWLKTNARCQEYVLPKPYDVKAITARVQEIITSHGLTVPDRLVSKLITTYGNNLPKIESELLKVGFSGEVTSLDLMQPAVMIWELGTYLMLGDKRSVFTVRQLGLEPDVKVLSILVKQFHEMIQIKSGSISLPTWKRAKLKSVIQKVSLEKVTHLSEQCFSALDKIKTGQPFDLEVWVMTML